MRGLRLSLLKTELMLEHSPCRPSNLPVLLSLSSSCQLKVIQMNDTSQSRDDLAGGGGGCCLGDLWGRHLKTLVFSLKL